jgi:hypothetical protein
MDPRKRPAAIDLREQHGISGPVWKKHLKTRGNAEIKKERKNDQILICIPDYSDSPWYKRMGKN